MATELQAAHLIHAGRLPVWNTIDQHHLVRGNKELARGWHNLQQGLLHEKPEREHGRASKHCVVTARTSAFAVATATGNRLGSACWTRFSSISGFDTRNRSPMLRMICFSKPQHEGHGHRNSHTGARTLCLISDDVPSTMSTLDTIDSRTRVGCHEVGCCRRRARSSDEG